MPDTSRLSTSAAQSVSLAGGNPDRCHVVTMPAFWDGRCEAPQPEVCCEVTPRNVCRYRSLTRAKNARPMSYQLPHNDVSEQLPGRDLSDGRPICSFQTAWTSSSKILLTRED